MKAKDLKEKNELNIREKFLENNLQPRDYGIEFLSNPFFFEDGAKTVLGAGTSSGKTELSLVFLSLFYDKKENKNKKTLIIPASKGILRDNFSDRLSS